MCNLIKDAYFSKSFYWLGESLDHCFGCQYCRAIPNKKSSYSRLPSDVNPNFTNLPVVINLFYGDPLLQVDTTKRYLELLEEAKHKGPIIIITKGNLDALGEFSYDLNINIALSTIGKYHSIDKVSMHNFVNNIELLHKLPKVKFSCEFRPIMYGVNDSREVIDNLFEICSRNKLPIGYSGIQGQPDLVQYWKDNNIDLKPFPGYKFSVKKPISQECFDIIKDCSEKYGVPIFKKTSCLVSYTNGLGRDYNAHYYRPNEMNCSDCVMNATCSKFKNSLSSNAENLNSVIPFDFEIVHRINHKCLMHSTCPNPHPDCTKIAGYLVKIDEKITTTDVRVIKWLTGYTVIAPFYESNFVSKKWYRRI